MAEASRRAARPARRGGLPNAAVRRGRGRGAARRARGLADVRRPSTCPGARCSAAPSRWTTRPRPASRGSSPRAAASRSLLAPAARDRLASEVDVAARLAGGLARGLAPARPGAVRGPAGDRRGDRRDARTHLGPAARACAPATGSMRRTGWRLRPRGGGERRAARSALLSSGHVRRPRPVRRHVAADPDRGRRPQPARHPRRPAAHATATRSRPRATATRRCAACRRPGPTSWSSTC